MPTPQRLLDWLAVNGLGVASCTEAELRQARELREAIHRATTAAATRQDPPPPDAVAAINEAARGGRAYAELTPSGVRVWRLGEAGAGRVADALAVVAADAIDLLVAPTRDRLALCASPTCREPFLDTSQSHTRRWCDTACSNRQKKARHRGHRPR